MKKSRRKYFTETAGGILCIAALLAGTMSPAGPAVQVRAEDAVGYIEQETADNKNDSVWGTPERIPVNQLCAGTVNGELSDGTPDYEDMYQVDIDLADFTAERRGRFHVELSTANGSNQSLRLRVSSGNGEQDYFDDDRSQRIETPSYSIAGPILIAITSSGDAVVNYHLKVVYDTIEGSWTETERNTARGNATPIRVNQDYWGCLHGYTHDEPAWYQYTLDKPGRVSVSLKPQDGKKPNESDLWRTEIYAYSRDPDEYDIMDSGNLAAGVKSDVYSLAEGTYYLCIWGNNVSSSVGQIYELRVDYEADSQQAAPTPTPTSTPEETEAPAATLTPTLAPTSTPEEKAAPAETETKTIRLTKVIHVKLKVSKKKSVALKWKKNKVAHGYQIYRSRKKNKGFRRVKTIKKAGVTRWKDTKVKSGRTYY